MKRFGLTEERYNQFKETFQFESAIEEIVEEYGADVCNKGYDIYDFDRTGMMEIQKIDYLSVFEDDEAAVEQAIKDGVKVIPVKELPENFDRKYLGWIDTPENRKAIQEYCNDKEFGKKENWIIGVGGSELDGVDIYRVFGRKTQVKQKMLQLIQETQSLDEDSYESGTETIEDIEERPNGSLYACVCFWYSHVDCEAVREKDIQVNQL